ncbi:hypothetical protein [Neobacillus niacini]|uniref:hypothetical protein n=1 Tax=Neobacillus niacini TaxID=86668 RepID=UPI0005EE06D6|nr:hypothetical protein [Neobacillus niacini]
MENAKYKLYYVNGETEVLETEDKYINDAKTGLNLKLAHKPTWIRVGGKHINLSNVISIEVVGENEKITLKPIKLTVTE